MKKVLAGFLVLAALGLILAACSNPADGLGVVSRAAVTLGNADREFAAVIVPKVSGRTNASGKDISSNGQGGAVPGMYFFWDPKQKDNGFLKVEASLLWKYESFILTTKEANKYWDFVIAPAAGQLTTFEGYYVFSIPKQEKNINGVWISDFAENSKLAGLYGYMDELYGDKHDFSSLSRAKKMKAFVLELALKAKSINPAFNIIVQDTMSLGFASHTSSSGALDMQFLSVIDGWGVENNSAGTLSTFQRFREEGGLKMTTTTASAASVSARDTNISTAFATGTLYFPRLGTAVYQEYGYPFFATNGDYMIVEDPAAAGVADKIHAGNVYTLDQAKNYLYMINPNRYSNWAQWDERWPAPDGRGGTFNNLNTATSYDIGKLVPMLGGRFNKPTQATIANIVNSPLWAADGKWDFWYAEKGRTPDATDNIPNTKIGGRHWFIEDLKASNWDVVYIDPGFADYYALHENEVDQLKFKGNGGRRQIVAYLSIGTAEAWRWFAGPDMVFWNAAEDEWTMATGLIVSGQFVPSTQFPDAPRWSLFPAYSGAYADESAIIWWHPEWRALMINGGLLDGDEGFQNQFYDHSQFANKWTSSIDRIVTKRFDGVYIDNVSRYSASNYTPVGTYDAAHPDYFWE